MHQIHVIKIKQNRLYSKNKDGSPSFDYFPFDRIYLIPKNQSPMIPQLFKYSFIIKMNSHITSALRSLVYTRTRHIGLQRNDEELAWKAPPDDPFTFLKDSTWLMVIPTYAYKSNVKEKHPVRLAYVITAAMNALHNVKVKLPTVTLQTPRGKIPLLCSVCTEIPAYYANKCTPGQHDCRRKMNVPQLRLDKTPKGTRSASIEEAGAIK